MAKRTARRQPPPQHLPQPLPSSVTGEPQGKAGIPAPANVVGETTEVDALIRAVEQARDSRVIVYWLTDVAKVSEGVVLSLYDQLTAIGKTDRLDLVLYTRGGDAEAPWRIISLIREFCDHLGVLIPHRAASAGTSIAIGANEIVMTPLAALGPIDPSRSHPLLPRREGTDEAEPISVQDMRHAMQFIREAAGPEKEMPYTPEAMATIFTALFEKIHPLAIGAIEQSYALSKLVGAQCLGTHMDAETDGPKIRAMVDKLCDDFKSHQYQISRAEARQIGLNVVDAPEPVEKALMDLYRFYIGRAIAPDDPLRPGQNFITHIGWIDSTELHIRVEAQNVFTDEGTGRYLGDQWAIYGDASVEEAEEEKEASEGRANGD